MKIITPAQAYWNQRHLLAGMLNRFELLMNAIGFENDLNAYQWAQLGAFALEYKPSLILELGRKFGNSTCLFTEIANTMDERCSVTSICWSKDFKQNIYPKLLARKIITESWADRLDILEADITIQNYEKMFYDHDRILVFWDAHGFEVASCVLGKIIPLLEEKEHYLLIHDLSDQRLMCDELYRYEDQKLWHGDSHSGERMVLGHINSAVAQAVSIYDFCSRNKIFIESADYTFVSLFKNTNMMNEMKAILGEKFFSLQGHWFFLSMNEHEGPFTYPRP